MECTNVPCKMEWPFHLTAATRSVKDCVRKSFQFIFGSEFSLFSTNVARSFNFVVYDVRPRAAISRKDKENNYTVYDIFNLIHLFIHSL